MDLKKYELAEQDYLRGMKYKEIANKYNVSLNTVKSWKTRYGWDKKSVHTKNKKVRTQKIEKKLKKEAAAETVNDIISNDTLTDDEQLFCLYYIKTFNATKAYWKVHPNVKYESAMVMGCNIMKKQAVKDEIARLKQAKMNKALLEPEDIFQKYIDIAFSDITDYVCFGREEVPVMAMYGPVQIKDESTGNKKTLTKEINVVKFKDSEKVDGTLISEVKQGKDGASVKLMDRMKALNWLAEHIDMATPEQAARVAYIKAQTDKLMGGGQEIEDLSDIEDDIYGNK